VRDYMVFKAALSRGVPIIMVLGGGYASDSAKAVSESIIGLIQGDLAIVSRLPGHGKQLEDA